MDRPPGRPRARRVLFVSSYFPELLGVCDRIAVFHRGRIVAVRPAGEWTDEQPDGRPPSTGKGVTPMNAENQAPSPRSTCWPRSSG